MKKKFYRSQLATIVWDSQNDKILADFKKGYFVTEDNRTARILSELGYPEVEIDSQIPPEIIVKQPSLEIIGDAPLTGTIPEDKFDSLVKKQKINVPKIKKIDLKSKKVKK